MTDAQNAVETPKTEAANSWVAPSGPLKSSPDLESTGPGLSMARVIAERAMAEEETSGRKR